MKEVKKCSISGVAFTMDADAYEALETYLREPQDNPIRTRPTARRSSPTSKPRIAELILSAQDNTRIVENR